MRLVRTASHLGADDPGSGSGAARHHFGGVGDLNAQGVRQQVVVEWHWLQRRRTATPNSKLIDMNKKSIDSINKRINNRPGH